MGDRRRGRVEGLQPVGNARVSTMVPLTEMFGYATDIRSISQGHATFPHGVRPLRGSPINQQASSGALRGRTRKFHRAKVKHSKPHVGTNVRHRPRQDDAPRWQVLSEQGTGTNVTSRRNQHGGAPARRHHPSTRPRTGTTPTSTAGAHRLHQDMITGAGRMERRDPSVSSAPPTARCRKREHVLLARQVCQQQSSPSTRRTWWTTPELLELVENYHRYRVPGDDIPVVQVSALKKAGDAEWTPKVLELMDVDTPTSRSRSATVNQPS